MQVKFLLDGECFSRDGSEYEIIRVWGFAYAMKSDSDPKERLILEPLGEETYVDTKDYL